MDASTSLSIAPTVTPDQAVAIAGHHPVVIIVAFLVGWAIHLNLQVNATAIATNNSMSRRRDIFYKYQAWYAARFLAAACIFGYFWQHPQALPGAIELVGIPVNATVVGIITLPMSAPVAAGAGFFLDSALGYIPWVKDRLALPPNGAPKS